MTTVYKVVNADTDKRLSWMYGFLDKKHIIEYVPGEWTFPREGKIFVFGEYADAIKVADSNDEVWLCEAENVTKCKDLVVDAWPRRGKEVSDYWAGAIEGDTPPPTGTLLADQIKLIRQVM